MPIIEIKLDRCIDIKFLKRYICCIEKGKYDNNKGLKRTNYNRMQQLIF